MNEIAKNEAGALRPAGRRGASKLRRRYARIEEAAFDALESVLKDESVKAADRISAIKLAFELGKQNARSLEDEDRSTVRVFFCGADKELAE